MVGSSRKLGARYHRRGYAETAWLGSPEAVIGGLNAYLAPLSRNIFIT